MLVIGGARSGKSRFAERRAHAAAAQGKPVTYLATAGPPRDAEMAERIERHQARRPLGWATREEALVIAPLIERTEGVLVIDCLTLWLTNVMLSDRDVAVETARLLEALDRRAGSVIAVSNEVGQGIVPTTPLGRRFRDAQGVLNHQAADAADTVVAMTAGCPIVVKPRNDPEVHL